jgi:16S rRNA (uracil1498-N3)-methyltransferase
MANRYYVNCPLQPGLVEVTGPEGRHLAAVCRVRVGDAVCLFNGDGHEYRAEVVEVARRAVTARILSSATPERELGFRLEVAAPLPRGDRVQFLIEKLTELGATVFVPLRTERSVVHPRDAKVEKLQRYVIEASKQCGRNVLMGLEPIADWRTYCQRTDLPQGRWLAHPGSESFPDAESRDSVVAVGPEGGFTHDEVATARTAGWSAVGLGPRILRIETAALVLAAWRAGGSANHG